MLVGDLYWSSVAALKILIFGALQASAISLMAREESELVGNLSFFWLEERAGRDRGHDKVGLKAWRKIFGGRGMPAPASCKLPCDLYAPMSALASTFLCCFSYWTYFSFEIGK